MKRAVIILLIFLVSGFTAGIPPVNAAGKKSIKAIYIPLADHYPGIVAYEKYRDKMKKADYTIERVKSWPLLRAYFMSGEVDMAFIVSPMAMDMFREDPNFRWVSLLHRDGNVMAINDLMNNDVQLPKNRLARKPDSKVAAALSKAKKELGRPSESGVPSLLSTHTVVLYKYLHDNGLTLGIGSGKGKDVVAIEVAPPKSPAFLKKQNVRGIPASFEQSLPWADVVETGGFGSVAWYSKDVLPWPNGHIECIVIATDDAIKNKKEALKEVINYLHKAGIDIEKARQAGGQKMLEISDMIIRHIPEHNQEAIVHSLRTDLNVINYRHLNVDKDGLRHIMDLALEGGILKEGINIEDFADASFGTEITEIEIAKKETDNIGYADFMTEQTRKMISKEILNIEKFVRDPIIINAVKDQNEKGMSLKDIKSIDKEWMAGGKKELIKSLQNNRVGRFLRDIVSSKKHIYTEAFLCDKNGAVVGLYPKTSDYWQGDEGKFTESYKNGNGEVFIGPLEFDNSTQSFSVQVSVPVKSETETIGVLVVGIRNINK